MSLPKPGKHKALDKCRGGQVGRRDGNGAGLNLEGEARGCGAGNSGAAELGKETMGRA